MNDAYYDFRQTGIRHYGYDPPVKRDERAELEYETKIAVKQKRDENTRKCTRCDELIFWARTEREKAVPLDLEEVTEGSRFLLKATRRGLVATYRGASFRSHNKAPGHRYHKCEGEK